MRPAERRGVEFLGEVDVLGCCVRMGREKRGVEFERE
jgi:hypothetical protein